MQERQAEYLAALGTLSEEARTEFVTILVDEAEGLLHHVGPPRTSYHLLQYLTAVAKVGLAHMLVEGYMTTTDKGFSVPVMETAQDIDPEFGEQLDLPYDQDLEN